MGAYAQRVRRLSVAPAQGGSGLRLLYKADSAGATELAAGGLSIGFFGTKLVVQSPLDLREVAVRLRRNGSVAANIRAVVYSGSSSTPTTELAQSAPFLCSSLPADLTMVRLPGFNLRITAGVSYWVAIGATDPATYNAWATEMARFVLPNYGRVVKWTSGSNWATVDATQALVCELWGT